MNAASRWFASNLAEVIVAVAKAGAALAGSAVEPAATQADTQPQSEVSPDE